MNAVNAVQLFILVWTFTAVCQDDEDVSVSCYEVTGSVGKEVNLTCSVSLERKDCCVVEYKFKYHEINNGSSICQDVPVNSCEQKNSFTCRYTPTTAMTEQFRFFVQTTCGTGKAEIFTLNTVSSRSEETAPGFKNTVITVVVVAFIIIIIIMMAIIYKAKPNSTRPELDVSESQT
ncbi:uncharacterized protein LOC132121707 isoform X3 [Carassius carassius]|uniref:uncharacterized protein LOC132121707 isoform X3 n=1 Tax=Carassius carassius TaxID=217509 RepID=UPI0028695CE6|nr:uncharacterized protein LOC132121707 isoform X3 [Carassius carassius]